MNINGSDFVDVITDRLEFTGRLCHDSDIICLIKGLTPFELRQIADFGNVQSWHNEKINQ